MTETANLKSILFISSNPRDTTNLRLEEEVREIKERLRLAGYGSVPIKTVEATRPIDIQQALLDFEPQVVHFSGHGAGEKGLVFENERGESQLVSSEALANLFKIEVIRNRVECVVLSACYTEPQAEAIARYIDCVIGMNQDIEDAAAISFSKGFYIALGQRQSPECAYEFGCNAIELNGFRGSKTPQLFLQGSMRSQDQHNPFYFESNREANTVKQLFALCQDDSGAARYHLMNGHFEAWFKYIGRLDLASQANQARQVSDDDSICLDAFIASDEEALFEKIKARIIKAKREKMIFLLVGRSGVGKSSTVNALLGEMKAKVDRFRRSTMAAQTFECTVQGIPCLVVDTPGLADASGNEDKYLKSIKSEASQFDCMLFVSRLDTNRVGDEEVKSIRLLSEAYGKEVWERAIIVLTHADKVSAEDYPDYVEGRTEVIREAISDFTTSEVANKIPSLAVSNNHKTGKPMPTPDGKLWLSELYKAVLIRISHKGFLPFLLATANRVKFGDGSESDDEYDIHLRADM